MEEIATKTQNSICKYKKINIDLKEVPLRLPKLELFHRNYRYTTLLKKIKILNEKNLKQKYSNRIIMTANQTREGSLVDGQLHCMTWRNLADYRQECLEMYNKVEIQNQRIKRLKIGKKR